VSLEVTQDSCDLLNTSTMTHMTYDRRVKHGVSKKKAITGLRYAWQRDGQTECQTDGRAEAVLCIASSGNVSKRNIGNRQNLTKWN